MQNVNEFNQVLKLRNIRKFCSPNDEKFLLRLYSTATNCCRDICDHWARWKHLLTDRAKDALKL